MPILNYSYNTLLIPTVLYDIVQFIKKLFIFKNQSSVHVNTVYGHVHMDIHGNIHVH